MAWLVVACAILVSTASLLAAVRIGPGRRDAPHWSTSASRRRDAGATALRLAPALLLGLLVKAYYPLPFLDLDVWVRLVGVAFLVITCARAARSGWFGRRAWRSVAETVAAAAAFSAGALAIDAAWHGPLARLTPLDSLGVQALLWLLSTGLCLVGFWTARLLSGSVRRSTAPGAIAAAEVASAARNRE